MPIMLLAWQPVIGAGTTLSQKEDPKAQRAAMGLNFVGPPEAWRN